MQSSPIGIIISFTCGSNALAVYRHFEVPNPINVDQVTASLENGLLRIKAPEIEKPKEAKAKAA
jgi:HSP20 family molecular chaperone IbpA